ncbi:MAG TPA: hypothetical protein VF535_07090 [Allosphingosinicella sp.]
MRNRILMVALATAGMAVGYATPAAAQATRTWVSGVGDDVNPCSRTAPCKTFAGAISKTAAGGEIKCLDPGGFGAVSINKSMTISCPYTEGGALAGGNGITINDSTGPAPNTSVVFLRGLDIFGVNPPSNGVRFITGAALTIEDSTIRRFNAASSFGVSIAPTTANVKVYMNNVTVADNGSGGTGGGIGIIPAVGGSVSAYLNNVRVQNNANNGLRVDSTNGAVGVTIDNSNFVGNGVGISTNGVTNNMRMMLVRSTVAYNNGFGILNNGATATMRVGDTTITGNVTGLATAGGASTISFLTNRLFGNPTTGAAADGAFPSTQVQN